MVKNQKRVFGKQERVRVHFEGQNHKRECQKILTVHSVTDNWKKGREGRRVPVAVESEKEKVVRGRVLSALHST